MSTTHSFSSSSSVFSSSSSSFCFLLCPIVSFLFGCCKQIVGSHHRPRHRHCLSNFETHSSHRRTPIYCCIYIYILDTNTTKAHERRVVQKTNWIRWWRFGCCTHTHTHTHTNVIEPTNTILQQLWIKRRWTDARDEQKKVRWQLTMMIEEDRHGVCLGRSTYRCLCFITGLRYNIK